MSIYFDFKTIDELAEENDNIYRQQRKFILDDDLTGGINRCIKRQINENTSKFKPDDWIRYIDPLVNYAMREGNQQGAAVKRAYQKYMLLGVLVGLGKTPQEAINQVQEWQTTGASQILKSIGNEINTGITIGISPGPSDTTGGITNSGTSNGLGGNISAGVSFGSISGNTGTGSTTSSESGINIGKNDRLVFD